MLANKKFSFHRPTISSGNVLSYQDPVTISLTTALNNANQANVVTFTIDTNLTTEPKLFYEITGNVSASDFTDSVPLYGSVTLDANGNATITKNVQSLGYANVDFVLNLRTGHPQTQIRATSNTVEYIDVPTVTATGGTETSNVDSFYKIHEFTANANLVVSSIGDTANFSLLTDTEYLIVGGGASGGGSNSGNVVGGGGGGGNVLTGNSNLTVSTFPAVVGTGGVGDTEYGENGKDSTFLSITAEGGSYGGGGSTSGNSFLVGGNGVISGGSAADATEQATTPAPSGANILYFGGTGPVQLPISHPGPEYIPLGGGGGAGAGGNAGFGRFGGVFPEAYIAGSGGIGTFSTITGSNVDYGGGGGGGGGNGYTPSNVYRTSIGGDATGGGGAGGDVLQTRGHNDGADGTDGRGGGGGGSTFQLASNFVGGDGGNGIVIVRYIEHYRKANIL